MNGRQGRLKDTIKELQVDTTLPIAVADLPSGIPATLIGSGAVDNTEFGYLNGVGSALQTQIDGLQTQVDAKIAKSLVDAKGDVITATANDTPARLAVGTDGQVLTADSAQATGIKWATPSSSLTLAAGTYTPTLTIVSNADSVTAYECQYMQVGTVVTVSGKMGVDPTAAGFQTRIGISLPVASNFGAEEDCAGGAQAKYVNTLGGAIYADAANDRAEWANFGSSTTNTDWWIHFTYQII